MPPSFTQFKKRLSRKRAQFSVLFWTLLTTGMGLPSTLSASGKAGDYNTSVKPLIEKYCTKCHGGEKQKAGVRLDGEQTHVGILQEKDLWHTVTDLLVYDEMPPEEPYPTDQERSALIDWFQDSLINVDWNRYHNPGRMGLSRLTEIEYRNAITDIFGLDLQAGVFLGQDPEGATGFTNDHETLTFSLFALQDFMREAERAADAFLAYRNAPWKEKIELEEAWHLGDKAVPLSKDGTGITLNAPLIPFHLNLELPDPGMYRFAFYAKPIDGEPVSGLSISVNGNEKIRLPLAGAELKAYSIDVNLGAGFNVLTLGYDPSRAHVIQPRKEEIPVPNSIERRFTEQPPAQLDLSASLAGNGDAEDSYREFNDELVKYVRGYELTRWLLDNDQVDYNTNSFRAFSPSKVSWNLTAGKVSVLLDTPQKALEKEIKTELGFDIAQFQKTANAYNKRYFEKYPERKPKTVGRALVDHVVIQNNPLNPGDKDPVWAIGTAQNAGSAKKILRRLANRAYRRKANSQEVGSLLKIYADTRKLTGSHFEGLKDAIVGLLISPEFLLHYTEGSNPKTYSINDYESAERLARFLWLSIPDEPLQALARKGALSHSDTIASTVDDMIQDERFERFCHTFMEQWLNLQNFVEEEDVNLVEAMRLEPGLLLRDLFREDRSLFDLINPDYTYLNETLASHYDIAGVQGPEMRKVFLETARRGGLLTMGSMLVSTSTRNRTSPVLRGAWIVENLLGIDLPPPPPTVPELKLGSPTRTIREELELHRQDSACSSCHERIDPYGFVLDNFDKMGMWRDFENGNRIDSSTTLENGTRIDGIEQFKEYFLEERKHEFARHLTEKVFEFALGRELQYYDEATVQQILATLEQNEFRARTLLREIVSSPQFLQQNNQVPKELSLQ